MELEIIMVSEISHTQKAKYHTVPIMDGMIEDGLSGEKKETRKK